MVEPGSNEQAPSVVISPSNNAVFQDAIESNGESDESHKVGARGALRAQRVFLSNDAIDHHVPFGTALPGVPTQRPCTETPAFTTHGFSGRGDLPIGSTWHSPPSSSPPGSHSGAS